MVLGLLAGLIAGGLIHAANSAALLGIVAFIEPIGSLWIGAMRMTVVPLIVAMLFASVASDASPETLGRIGVATLGAFVGLLVFSAATALLVARPLIDDMKLAADVATAMRATATAGAVETAGAVAKIPSVSSWLTSLAPSNVIKAAADGAMVSIIVFTLVFALAARRINPALRDSLIALFGGIANAMTRIVGWILAFAPIGIFAIVLGAVSRRGAELGGAMAYYVIAVSSALVLFALLMYPVASMIGQIPLGWFTRAVLPAQVVGLSSGSSVASLPALVEGARALQLPSSVTGAVVPLSASAFRVATPITWLMGALFLAKLYGVTLSVSATLMIALIAIALSFTIPGVPHGAQLMLAPLLVRYGIPAEGVALLIAVDTIPDLLGTVTNVTGDMVVAAVVARVGVAERAGEPASSLDA
jgi:Na+/H+-dicarboxylate symporter